MARFEFYYKGQKKHRDIGIWHWRLKFDALTYPSITSLRKKLLHGQLGMLVVSDPYLGLQSQYRLANFSISLSIFCASPGNLNPCKNNLKAGTNSIAVKRIRSTYSYITSLFNLNRTSRCYITITRVSDGNAVAER